MLPGRLLHEEMDDSEAQRRRGSTGRLALLESSSSFSSSTSRKPLDRPERTNNNRGGSEKKRSESGSAPLLFQCGMFLHWLQVVQSLVSFQRVNRCDEAVYQLITVFALTVSLVGSTAKYCFANLNTVLKTCH